MSLSIRSLRSFAAVAMLSSVAYAGDFVGLDQSGNLVDMDTVSGNATVIGPISGAPPFGFANIARALDGSLYGLAPGAIGGYSVYSIDESTQSAQLLHSVATNQGGNVGFAVDPSGSSVWVAGFVQLSFLVKVDQVDLSSGVATPRGTLGGNMWGLAFDGAGDLFTTIQSGNVAQLIKLDQIDVANGSLVGSGLTGVDINQGLALSSQTFGNSVHVFSRVASTVHTVDTANGTASLVATLSGAGAVWSFTDSAGPACPGTVVAYGSGCPGAGAIVPTLSISGCPTPGDIVTLQIANGLGGSTALLLFGLNQASIPVGGGCSLLVSPVIGPGINLPLAGMGVGTGSIAIPGVIPAGTAGASVTMQAFVFDVGSPLGASSTNGVQMTIN